jgi:Flp pilus assembly protein TadB
MQPPECSHYSGIGAKWIGLSPMARMKSSGVEAGKPVYQLLRSVFETFEHGIPINSVLSKIFKKYEV